LYANCASAAWVADDADALRAKRLDDYLLPLIAGAWISYKGQHFSEAQEF
jgi:hypothetical protein